MKKPFAAWTVKMATTIFVAMPKAAMRLTQPRIKPIEPANSAATARNASGAGMCICCVKNSSYR